MKGMQGSDPGRTEKSNRIAIARPVEPRKSCRDIDDSMPDSLGNCSSPSGDLSWMH